MRVWLKENGGALAVWALLLLAGWAVLSTSPPQSVVNAAADAAAFGR